MTATQPFRPEPITIGVQKCSDENSSNAEGIANPLDFINTKDSKLNKPPKCRRPPTKLMTQDDVTPYVQR